VVIIRKLLDLTDRSIRLLDGEFDRFNLVVVGGGVLDDMSHFFVQAHDPLVERSEDLRDELANPLFDFVRGLLGH
jgi:hypothetical protein